MKKRKYDKRNRTLTFAFDIQKKKIIDETGKMFFCEKKKKILNKTLPNDK